MIFSLGARRRATLVCCLLLVIARLFLSWSYETTKPNETINNSKTAKVPLKLSDEEGFVKDGSRNICSMLKSREPFSLSALWQHELGRVKAALLHSPAVQQSKDQEAVTNKLKTLAEQVIQALPPGRLRRSLRPQSLSPEHHEARIRRILNILWECREKGGPKLNVLVFGGSPTVGSNCERNGRYRKQGYCAWPGHLQDFANAYLGFDGVRVVNFGMGASTSEVATMMIKFGLFPPAMAADGPDVIINAYAVNDFERTAAEENGFQRLFMDFLESTNSLRNCEASRPLVIYLDDLVNNCFDRNQQLERTELFHSELDRLASWHQVMTIAYSDMVKDFVYADRKEQALLVDWKGDCKHMTWAGHVAIVLSFAFNAMNSVLDFCGDMSLQGQQLPTGNRTTADLASWSSKIETLDSAFRPPLNSQVVLKSVKSLWEKRQNARDCSTEARTYCTFAWVAMRREEEMGHMREVSEIIQKNAGWQDNRRWPPTNYGLYGTVNGSILLNVTDHRPVNTIYFMYMKSYSDQWKGSQIKASVFLGDTDSAPVAAIELSGFHEKRTSEYFTAQLQFNVSESQKNNTVVLLLLNMTGGETFKIGGLSFCNN